MKVCLECATPKKLWEGTITRCHVCKKDTHSIVGQPRRSLCHDCNNFRIPCRDGSYRPALNEGKRGLQYGVCRAGSCIQDKIIRKIAPSIVRYTDYCDGFQQDSRAPRDGRPNPLSDQERNDWRRYLEAPIAFWNDPQRWEGIDPHKKAFWEKKTASSSPKSTIAAVGIVALGAAIALGSKKKMANDS